jgi:tRNA(adenine34) deaminase
MRDAAWQRNVNCSSPAATTARNVAHSLDPVDFVSGSRPPDEPRWRDLSAPCDNAAWHAINRPAESPVTSRPAQSPMLAALAEAEAAGVRGEVPVGAVVVAADGALLASAGNRTRELADPTAHAEMLAIRQACAAQKSERLDGADLYVTLEPCPMCAAAASFARIRRLYFGAADPKGGGVEHGPRIFSQPTCHHAPEVYGGIEEVRAGALLRDFFARRR